MIQPLLIRNPSASARRWESSCASIGVIIDGKLPCAGDLEAGMAAGIDASERLQVIADVQCQSVIGKTTAHAKAE